jgi:REP element-mobilizing transposase RayT
MKLNELGKMANEYWLSVPQHYSEVELDEFMIMPNHVDGIII